MYPNRCIPVCSVMKQFDEGSVPYNTQVQISYIVRVPETTSSVNTIGQVRSENCDGPGRSRLSRESSTPRTPVFQVGLSPFSQGFVRPFRLRIPDLYTHRQISTRNQDKRHGRPSLIKTEKGSPTASEVIPLT